MNTEANNTFNIFSLATFETQTGIAGFGLTASSVDRLAGCIGLHANNENEFVKEAQGYAELFCDIVSYAIEGLAEAEIEYLDEPSKSALEQDLAVLKNMLDWTCCKSELEKLAREDWQIYHPAE